MMNGLLVRNVCISRTLFRESLANDIIVYHQYTIRTQFIEQNQWVRCAMLEDGRRLCQFYKECAFTCKQEINTTFSICQWTKWSQVCSRFYISSEYTQPNPVTSMPFREAIYLHQIRSLWWVNLQIRVSIESGVLPLTCHDAVWCPQASEHSVHWTEATALCWYIAALGVKEGEQIV